MIALRYICCAKSSILLYYNEPCYAEPFGGPVLSEAEGLRPGAVKNLLASECETLRGAGPERSRRAQGDIDSFNTLQLEVSL